MSTMKQTPQELFQAITAFGAKARAATPNKDAKVEVVTWSRGYDDYTEVRGTEEEVLSYVSYRLANDSFTMMYDHMALRICKVEGDEKGDTKIAVLLSKNRYAGD